MKLFAGQTPPKKSRIDMVPFMDTIFILIVFFIYAFLTMKVWKGVEVTLPAARSTAPVTGAVVGVDVTRDGTVVCGGRVVPVEDIARCVRAAALREGGTPRVVLSCDKRAGLGVVVEVMDALRIGGFGDVYLESVDADTKNECLPQMNTDFGRE